MGRPFLTENDFWKKLDCSGGDDSCWSYVGSRNNNRGGYGVAWWKGKVISAHRLSWFLKHGDLPKGMHVLHRCDNPPCCNPQHLFLGDDAANVADKCAKGRQAKGKMFKRTKLSLEDVNEIRTSIGISGREMAKKYRVSESLISMIRNNLRQIEG